MKYKVILNFREFKNGEETRPLDIMCSVCGKVPSMSIKLSNNIYFCKGCLSEMIDNMNKTSLKMYKGDIKNGERVSIE